MEKSDKIKVVKGTFEWSDLGSNEALFDYFSTKGAYVKDSNLIIAETAHVELH
jgi:mannose-1-phosphate guanylyltransferase